MAPRPLGEETENADADDALLGRLMRSVGALPESELRKRRVLTALRARASAHVRPMSRPMLRPALAAAGLLVIGGIAGATVGRAAWDRVVTAPSAPKAHVMPAAAITPHPSSLATPTVAAPARTPLVEPAAAIDPVVAAPANGERGPNRPRRIAAANDLAPRAAAYGPGDAPADTALVYAARQALNKEQNPARARVLCDDYLARAPNGMLAEEALALSIKAAADLQDSETASLARRYLARYPDGRFRELAQNAIARFPDAAPIK